ncbi:unnamed protein product [Fraxinus pennsylvanica]|uniref:Uncharacterized protein n=1 Tax=Fraxinus pennsylvanica TaxID=56036 RepID=A0AAD1Z8G4_9LAMI|nr:unnamed protein product [Fraxinus pennsylvanica]
MCTQNEDVIRSSHPIYSTVLRRRRLSNRLNRRWRIMSKEAVKRANLRKMKVQMAMDNLKLYIKNKIIIEENQRLRKKTLALHQENKALMSQLLLNLYNS